MNPKLVIYSALLLASGAGVTVLQAQEKAPTNGTSTSGQATTPAESARIAKLRKTALLTPPDRRVTVRLKSGEKLRGHIWSLNNNAIHLAVDDPHPGFLAIVYEAERAPTQQDVPFEQIASIRAEPLIKEAAVDFGRLAFIGAAVPLSMLFAMSY